MNQTLSSGELKALAREQLLGKYKTTVGAVTIVLIINLALSLLTITIVDTSTFVGNILFYAITFLISLISSVFSYGQSFLYLNLCCNNPISTKDVFYGFHQNSGIIFGLAFILTIADSIFSIPVSLITDAFYSTWDVTYLMLSCVVILVLGIAYLLFTLTYSQLFYMALDFPDYSVKEVMHASKQIMHGNKGRLFYIYVSFIPLYLLGFLSCGIGLLWVVPYVRCTLTNFFLDIMRKRN